MVSKRTLHLSMVLLHFCNASLGMIEASVKKVKKRKSRRWWVRPINLNRDQIGHQVQLVKVMSMTDHEEFFAFTRMEFSQYQRLLGLVRPLLEKKSIRTPLSPELRLTLTLNYLAHGNAMRNQAWDFRIGRSTAHKVVRETCRALWEVLQPLYMKTLTKELLEEVAEGFWERWNFPHCIGSLHGKHVSLQCPPRRGTVYYNYKQFFSIVLMAICDAHYRFIWVDIGDYGHISDGGIWSASQLGRALEAGDVPLPPPKCLQGSDTVVPYTLVADEAFPLKTYLMRPYPRSNLGEAERIFNYRLSRARRIIENTFGIMASRWRILRKPMMCTPETAEDVVKATACLHNFLMSREDGQPTHNQRYCPPGMLDREVNDGPIVNGEWRCDSAVPTVREVGRVASNNPTRNAITQRDQLRDYFVSDVGEVDWQYERAFQGTQINVA